MPVMVPEKNYQAENLHISGEKCNFAPHFCKTNINQLSNVL